QSSLALKPTVAAHAMWVTAALYAYAQSGGEMKGLPFWPPAQPALESMKAVTPEDDMCKGFTRAPNEPGGGGRNRDKAIAMRDSPIARTFRAATAVAIGLNESDLKVTESGLKDIRQAKIRLGDNYFVRFTSAQGHLNAAILYGKAGQFEKQEAAL